MSVSGIGRIPARPHRLKTLGSVLLMGALFVTVVPQVSGAPWSVITEALRAVAPRHVAVLVGIWVAGLMAQATVLRAAMPGLTQRRALTLSLTGSAVSNVLPFGGALGVSLNFYMSRAWGFHHREVVVYTFLTNLWDVLAKLSLPALGLLALLASGDVVGAGMTTTALVALAALAALLASVTIALLNDVAAHRLTGIATQVVSVALRCVRSRRTVDLEAAFLAVRRDSMHRLRTAWPRLTAGTVAYSLLLFALLWECLHFTGSELRPPEILAAFALERLLTLAVITPGGAGLVEVGLTGFLVTLGADAVAAVAGVLLYRAFTFALEIPVGGVGLAAWLWLNRRTPHPRRDRPGSPSAVFEESVS